MVQVFQVHEEYINGIVSVVLDNKKMIDDFFLFSVNDFTRTNFLILFKNSALYRSSKIESTNVEEVIIQLTNRVINP